MKKHGQLITLALIASASVIFGMVLAGGLNLTLPGRAAEAARADDRPLHAAATAQLAAAQGTAGTLPASFADIAERVNPAVVSITTTETVKPKERGKGQPFHGDPFEFFFGPEQRRRFAPEQQEEPRLEVSGGSGFLINDDLLVTNHHVLPDAETASAAIAEFNYEGSYDGLEVEKDPRELDPHTFWTSVGDDLAVVRVNGAPGKVYGAITVGDATVAVGARIAIIQHAGGQAKQVAMGHNAVVFSSTKCVQYLTDTLGGSSGSPVFDREWRLVAVHHAGGWLHEAGSKGRYYRNEGIPVAVLRAGLVTARLLP